MIICSIKIYIYIYITVFEVVLNFRVELGYFHSIDYCWVVYHWI